MNDIDIHRKSAPNINTNTKSKNINKMLEPAAIDAETIKEFNQNLTTMLDDLKKDLKLKPDQTIKDTLFKQSDIENFISDSDDQNFNSE